ncbi:hypothetical protein EIP91_008933 [Steccherinum ochraceum]|uniref:Uncharacterized protein n=1 Tax=Steccherinum ochraceum TaxID=92696 RepID=A0A4R0RWD6_9APHY|nr:hypothetical protein EIP91_008933 [Steccherinum ochraceum]
MQAYHSSGGNPQYYPQAQYPHPGPYYAHTPYGPQPALYPPGPQPFPGVYPVEYQEAEEHAARAAAKRYPVTPHIRPKYLNRSQSAQVSSSRSKSKQQQPPKSIMKKSHDRTASMGAVDPLQLSRSRSNSNPRPGSRPSSREHGELSRPPSRQASMRQRANSSTRPQLDPTPPFVSDHVFLSLHGTNEIRIEGIAYQEMVEDLRENLLPCWPYGVSQEDSREHKWRAQFSGSPWTSSGTDFLFTRRLLCRLFAVFSNQGYTYLTTINTAATTNRLIFTMAQRDVRAYFFSVSISPSGDKMTIVDGPQPILPALDAGIRSIFPRKIASNRHTEDGVYKIEVKKNFGGAVDIDKTLFVAFVLQFFRMHGFVLNGSFPLGRSRSPLAFGARKEVWIFKGSSRQQAESANGH